MSPVDNKLDSQLPSRHCQQICKLPLPIVSKPDTEQILFCKHLSIWGLSGPECVADVIASTCTGKQEPHGWIWAARHPEFPSWSSHRQREGPVSAEAPSVVVSLHPARWGTARCCPLRGLRTPCRGWPPAPCPSRRRPRGGCGRRSRPGASTKYPAEEERLR